MQQPHVHPHYTLVCRSIVLLLTACLLALFGTPALAQMQQLTLAAGDTLQLTCPTQLSGERIDQGAIIRCAPALEETPAPPTPPPASSTASLAIIGDSSSDEYQGSAPRGGAYQATTFNWAELLVRYRGINLGPWGDYPEPRRTGYAYNWARSGATTDTMLASGQHRGIAEQIRRGEVAAVLIWIGVNDFGLTDLGARIRDGRISPAEQQERLDRIVSNIAEAIQTLKQAGDVRIMLAPVQDLTSLPVTLDGYGFDADPMKQARLRAAIANVNDQLRQLAAREGIAFYDTNQRLLATVQSRASGNCIMVGSSCITFTQGEAPTNLGLDRYWHPGTVMSGLIANTFIEEINPQFGTDFQPFSDSELLQIAGIGHVASTGLEPNPDRPRRSQSLDLSCNGWWSGGTANTSATGRHLRLSDEQPATLLAHQGAAHRHLIEVTVSPAIIARPLPIALRHTLAASVDGLP